MDQQSDHLFNNLLNECGVTEATLNAGQKNSLDRDGYVVLPAVIDPAMVDRLRRAFDQHTRTEQSGTRHISDPINADRIFDIAFTHVSVLAAVHHVLKRPFKLTQFGGRDPLPGYGQQGLHTDSMQRFPDEPFRVVTAIWIIDDFTANNGATRVVPGTHLQIKPVPKTFAAPTNKHSNQIVITAKAGSILIFNGHLWHSATKNESTMPRRTLQCSFYGREMKGAGEINCNSPECLTPTAKYILGLSAVDNG
ncbi:MAG TPA: phytanoyl-CoA dioxygenase family protein [Blastocatellia bacterium]|nr:phytanoyl-CoA dioxygenase family protein [Blastocatellia bacterium]